MSDEPNIDLLYRQGGTLLRVDNPELGKWGKPPAVILVNPKYPHNVGAVVRAASCYGVEQVWITGNRVSLDPGRSFRLPREERMKGYADVHLFQNDRPLYQFRDITPIAVEVRENAESLHEFTHPANPIYIFGPEDGSLGREILVRCHRFIQIPTKQCLNLSAAVYTVLYDRALKESQHGSQQT